MPWFTEPISDNPKYPCRACNRTIAKNHRKLKCITCNYRIHIKCNKTEQNEYNQLPSKSIQTCVKCLEEALPFYTLDEIMLQYTINNRHNIISNDCTNQPKLDITKYPCRGCNRTIAKKSQMQNMQK